MEVLNHPRRLRRFFLFSFVVGLLLVLVAQFSAQEQEEYAVKAAFMFNFTKFIEWPPASGSGTFGICILGEDPFDATIDQLTQGKTAFGRAIQVRRLKDPAEAKTCQIAFVGLAERAKSMKVLDAVRGMPVLTVGESQEFLRMGGMVALAMEDSRVSIGINNGLAQNVNLKISAKLLSLAKIYKNDSIQGK